jgi:inosine-uridine nucleoside N-ribohydrolase
LKGVGSEKIRYIPKYGINTGLMFGTYNLKLIMKVWLDCDPGHDDMLAIVMAALSPQLNLLGLSTSAGNSTIENTTRNALDILHEIGRDDIQVVRGADQPLCCKLETAPSIHGLLGLEGAVLERSPMEAITEKPFLHIYQLLVA